MNSNWSRKITGLQSVLLYIPILTTNIAKQLENVWINILLSGDKVEKLSNDFSFWAGVGILFGLADQIDSNFKLRTLLQLPTRAFQLQDYIAKWKNVGTNKVRYNTLK